MAAIPRADTGNPTPRPTPPAPAITTALATLANEARAFVGAAKAPATRRAYHSDRSHFETWCGAHGVAALPASPEAVALYLTGLARVAKPSTLQRRVSSLSQAHEAAGHSSPTRRGCAPPSQASAAPAGQLPARRALRSPRTCGPWSGRCPTRWPERATAPCCWWASPPRCADPS